MQENWKTMPQRKKALPVFVLLVLALIGSILIFNWRLQASSSKLGYGPVAGNLNLTQKLRYSIQIYLARESLVKQTTPADLKLTLEIQPGESVQSICNHLNLLHSNLNPKLCRDYLVYSGLDRNIEPGSYAIPSGVPAFQVFQTIANPSNRDRALYIYPGWRLEEIAAAIESLGLRKVPPQSLLALLQTPTSDLKSEFQIPAGKSLEGYIMPGEYAFEPGISSAKLILQLITPYYELFLTGELQTKGQEHGLSPHEVLILASIIQRETLRAEEMPRMASVFYNRLAQDMPLQTDPTVQYAIGYDQDSDSWWKPLLSRSDLQVNSIYNTYQVTGLPPGPIASPGFEAIRAVLNPEDTDFLFFRAKCDGSGLHDFSVTYQEHLDKACP